MQVMTTLHITVSVDYEDDTGKRIQQRLSGLNIPAGPLDSDEDLVEAVCREVRRALLP